MIRSVLNCIPCVTQFDSFEYPVLHHDDSIRLLILHPGKFGSQISCSLREYRLNEEPQYEALSYCWGDQTQSFPILCNKRCIPAFHNLLTALHYLRSDTAPRTLWIDALCINQKDPIEKNAQVALLTVIFKHSSRVLAWLGEETEDTSLALEAVTMLSERARTSLATRELFHHPDKPFDRRSFGLNPQNWDILGLQEAHRKALVSLYSMTWFTRAWILQEVSCWTNSKPPDALIGHKSVSWADLCNVRQWLDLKQIIWFNPEQNPHARESVPGFMCIASAGITKREAYNQPKGSLLDLLQLHIQLQSSDPRDIVYSLIGVADAPGMQRLRQNFAVYGNFSLGQQEDSVQGRCTIHMAVQTVWAQYLCTVFPAPPVATRFLPRYLGAYPRISVQELIPDYQEPVERLLEDTTRMLVADELSLDVLLFKMHDSTTNLQIPSWVPDWSNMNALNTFQFTIASDFTASAQIPAWIDPYPRDGLLEVGAIVCARVSWISMANMRCNDYDPLILHQLRHSLHHIKQFPIEESIIDAYWRTLVMNRHVGKGFGRKKPPQQFRLHFTAALAQVQQFESDFSSNVSKKGDSARPESCADDSMNEAILEGWSGNGSKEEFWTAARFWSQGRRFFLCESGFMGVGPPDTMVGDYVMVLKGGALPFVLRACNEQSSTFADKTLEIGDIRTYRGVIPDLEFDVSKECSFPPDLLDYLGLESDQVGGPVDIASQSIKNARNSKLENFLREEVARRDKVDQHRYSLVGCSYVHGLSEGEALLQVDPLYSRDYLLALGNGWKRVFLQ